MNPNSNVKYSNNSKVAVNVSFKPTNVLLVKKLGLVFVEEIFFRTGFRVDCFLETDNDDDFVFCPCLRDLMVVDDLVSDPGYISANREFSYKSSLLESICLRE